MVLQTLILQPEKLVSLCAVCISDNNGGKIALTIIVSALILLGFANFDISNRRSNFSLRSLR